MVGHTVSELYARILHKWISDELESERLEARGHTNLCPKCQTTDHISTFKAITKETCYYPSKVDYCCVDLQKLFYTILKEALFQGLRDIGISETLLDAIVSLYESILGCVQITHPFLLRPDYKVPLG